MRFRELRAGLALLISGSPLSGAVAQVVIADEPDPLMSGLSIPADAPVKGMWSPVRSWPLVGLHLALMPSGVVMSYGTPLGKGVQDGRTFDIWDPAKGLDPISHFTLPNAQAVDSFCSAAAFLSTGAMLISGGNTPASGFSAQASTSFDPATEKATTLAAKLAYPRWYASMITLTDGRALIVGGSKPYVVDAYKDVAGSLARGDVSMTPEIYTPGSGWSVLTAASSRDAFGPDNNRWWYPRMWVAPGGKVFGMSVDKMWSLDVAGAGALRIIGSFKTAYDATRKPNVGPTSTAAMFDVGRILQLGGNGGVNGQKTPSSAAATIIDVRGQTPALTEVAPMQNPRQWANSTILADGKVVVTGGTRYADNAGADAVYPAEIWNPATKAWTLGASAAIYRGYHSAAVLLPDGAILSTGGGVPGPALNLNAEIYYPPYLFTKANGKAILAARPQLARASALKLSHGGNLTLELAASAQIAKVAVLGLGSTTHSFNSGQRYIPLAFQQSGKLVSATLPAGSDIAPPGYYMVFVIDAAGVPSKGVIVSIGGTPTPPAQPQLPMLAVGASRSFQAVNYPDRMMRHYAFLGFLDRVGAQSPSLTKLDAAFTVRQGLGDPACYSLESRNYPGYYLRHYGFRLRLDRFVDNAAYRMDATFCGRLPLSGSTASSALSLESRNYPGYFIRHKNFELWVERFDGTSGNGADATFSNIQSLQ
jgi:galactose oxidase